MTPRLMLRMAIKRMRLASPLLACSPANWAIRMGPPMVLAGMTREINLTMLTTVNSIPCQV